MGDPREALGYGRTPPTDYAQRQAPGGRDLRSRAAVGALTALGALVVGFLITTGMSAGREEALAQLDRKDELIELILERQEHADELAAQLDDLRARVDEAQAEAAAGVPALQAEVERVELSAGLTDLRGPGLRVTLRDAANCPATDYACQVQDRDVQQAVNALFEAGAEAVAVGGERVMSTTAIRSAGQTIIVNLRVLPEPYALEAIGEPESLLERFAASAFARDFETWTQEYGLRFDVEEEDELVIPRFSGTVGMDARPAGPAEVEQE